MKKNDWILTFGVAIYSYLFYQQNFGINFLIFSIALIILLLIRNGQVVKNRSWLLAAAGTILSACCVAYYGNTLSFIANIISLAILSAFSVNPRTSIITSLFFSMYSILASYIFVILDAVARNQNKIKKEEHKSGGLKFLLYLIPFIIVIVFFFMYKASNPLFDNFTKKINLDFISIGWLLFTFGGFFLMYGFFYHKKIKLIANGDESAPDTLSYDLVQNKKTFLKLGIDNEKISGVALLLMLNILLLIVNTLDANFLFFDGALPKDLSYSSFVHQGTGALIMSIIVAILIIMYYFRGELNFYKGNKFLKLLAFLWVLQNAFMIISTAYRNNLYINEYCLTYKRIGVYIWLLLAMIGLITTFVKVFKVKSNWFLFRSNGWLFYAVLVISPVLNWDVMVTNFNINSAEVKHKSLDKSYLISLSDNNIPQLLQLNDSIKDSVNVDNYDRSSFSYRYEIPVVDYKSALHNKLYHFLEGMQKQEWQSFCFEKKRVYNEIFEMRNSIQEINLQNYYLETLQPLDILENLKTIYFSNNHLTNLSDLKMFPALENVYLTSNQIDSIDFFPRMDALKTLSLSGNNFKKLYQLKNAPNITFLDLSNTQSIDFKTMPSLKKLTTLLGNNIYINDFNPLKRLTDLKCLSLSNSIINNKNSLPTLVQIEKLTVQSNQINYTDTAFFEKLSHDVNLTNLNLSDNQLGNLYPLTSYYDIKKTLAERNKLTPTIPSLKSLDVSRNSIYSLYPLTQYKNLEELYVSGNSFTETTSFEQFTNLKILSIDNCNLRSIAFLKKLKLLETLNISNNNITDYAPLYYLKMLKQVSLGTITKSEMQKLKKALPTTKIYAQIIN
jgi:Leucine-rich repeat (LRR) protein